jgi:predicted amidohydrolase
MPKKIKISTIVPPLVQPESKRAEDFVVQVSKHISNELEKVLPERPDFILLPEVCDFPLNETSGFSNQDFFRARGNRIYDMLAEIAAQNNCNIGYSTKYFDSDGKLVNGTRFISRSGKLLGGYEKNFPIINEMKEGVKAGTKHQVIETDCGKIAGVICFDLNFDELRLAYAAQQPDIIMFSSFYHGGLMQQYWAYSCRSFFVGAVSPSLTRPSVIIAPNGRILAETTDYFNYATAVINLDRVLLHLDYNWPKLTEIKKKYGPEVEIDDTGKLASVLLYGNSDNFTVADLIREYELEPLDDYLTRSGTMAKNPANQYI